MGWLTALLQIGGSVMAGNGAKRAGAENAREELAQSGVLAKQIRRRALEARGAARAGYASSGVDVSEGSPAGVDERIVWDSEYDVMNALLSGKRRAAAAKAGGAASAASYNASALSSVGNQYGGWLSARSRPSGSMDSGQSTASWVSDFQ